MIESEPLVSISCITYNHISYIRQCLDGFILQKTSFSFEVLIHDDASTDGTTDVIREYERIYPHIIKPIYEKENQWVKGKRGSIVFNYPRAKGKYIALCEGDDYWTDPLKLQKQVDLMETYTNYSLCFHATNCVRADDVNIVYNIIRKNKSDFNVCDLILGGGGFMSTNSMLFPAKYIDDMPKWVSECPVGDLPLMLLLGTKGNVVYIDEIMSSYRVGAGGYTSTIGTNPNKIRKHYNAIFSMFDDFDKWSDFHYHDAVVQRKKKLHRQYYVELLMCSMKRLLGENLYFKLHAAYKRIRL